MATPVHVGIVGHEEGNEEDPFVIVGPFLDQPILKGPISGPRREDLQITSALFALAYSGTSTSPVGVCAGDDPPDRFIHLGGREWGVELTELTMPDIRQELADVRRFARNLQKLLLEHSGDYQHLLGKSINLAKLDSPLPRKQDPLLAEIAEALKEGRGFSGQDMDLGQGPPQKLNMKGIYGGHGGFHVIVNPGQPLGDPGSIMVSAHGNYQIHASEAIEALAKRIDEKDKECNELLIITCGLVDNYGYTCPADEYIMRLLAMTAERGKSVFPRPPKHIKGILVHQWHTQILYHWERDADVPWAASV